jgi:UDP-glucuronate 4-epimerase
MNNFKDLSILVTGAAGFIGSHLTESLLQAGAQVTGVDNFDPYYSREEKERNLADCLSSSRFRMFEGDIRDTDLMRRVFDEAKPRVLVHLAARAGVRPSLEDPAGYADVNVRGTAVLLEAARVCGVRNIVFASSSSVYGNKASLPFRESDKTDHPLSPYGATKKAGELLCHVYSHIHGLSVSCLRFFTVYGPRQRPDLAIRKFVELAMRNEELPIYGDGTTERDYTHIRDILTGIHGAIRWGMTETPRFGIFNLGSSHPIVLSDLVDKIEQLLGRPVRRKHLPMQPGDMPATYADTHLAESELGFRHDVLFDDGLREFMEWMKTRGKQQSS